MNENITINIKKPRKSLRNKCRKIKKQHNNNDKTLHENKEVLPEVKVEATDFLNKIAEECDINTKSTESFNILDPSYFYSDFECYGMNSAYI